MSHPFWEAYLDFEVRMDAKDNECRILEKIIHVPTQQYTRYFERFRNRAADRPVEQIVQPDVLAQLQSDLTTELDGRPTTALEYERLLRARIDQFHLEVYHRTATEVQKRWQFEELLKRPYFHVTTLEEIQVITWRQYLTFEQQEGDETRIIFLFERCLVTCALYDEFWFKYLHWMLRLPNKQEEVRLLYMRASCLFVPIGRPAIRHSWARFEEAMGRAEVAKSICEGILAAMPSQLEAITHIANISRRQHGLETGLDVFDRFLGAAGVDHWHAASLIAEKARMMWNATGHVDKTRHLYHAHLMTYLDSRYLWINFVRFELGLPATLEKNEDAHQRVRDVIKLVMEKATLPPHVMQDLIQLYMDWLDERGVGNVCEEWLWLDKETHGYACRMPFCYALYLVLLGFLVSNTGMLTMFKSSDFMVRSLLKTRLADDGQESTTDRRLASENGHPGVAVNDALVRRGHNIYARYYEEQGETPAMNVGGCAC